MNAVVGQVVTPAAIAPPTTHVFAAGQRIGQAASQIAAVIDPVFVAEIGWDPVDLVLFPPPEHPLLGWPVCRAAGCLTTATNRGRVCFSCRRRLAERGLGVDEIDRLPVRAHPSRGPGDCVVAGCAREWSSSRHGLCRAHADLQQKLDLPEAGLLSHP